MNKSEKSMPFIENLLKIQKHRNIYSYVHIDIHNKHTSN